ncbi:MAG: NAD(P)H-dependent oxidoreductase subunit E, partial [Alphaproteobacteria bacterium]
MPTIRTTQVSIQSPHAASGDAAPCAWSKPAQKAVTNILSRYPKDRSRSATIPLLHLAQREFGGWLSIPAMQLVADTLNLP